MKHTCLFILVILGQLLSNNTGLFSQVSINTEGSQPHNSAMLDVNSSTKGLLIPRMTTAQRNTLGGIATEGLMVFDSDLNKFCFHDGSAWLEFSVGNPWSESTGVIYTPNANNKTVIGSSAPLGKLHVHDPENHTSSIYITPQSTTAGDSARIFFAEDHDATYGMFWLYDGSGGDEMELWGSSNGGGLGPWFKVKRSTGDVALGNTYATGYKLSVGGKVICTELRVNQVANWPDYVFDPDYPLISVPELSAFVENNGHLPGLPPATEIEGSGMDVGEMQRLMMEKIEELTLYIIQQQKEIDDLKEQMATDSLQADH